MQNGGFHLHPMMRTTLIITMIFLTGFIAVNFLVFFSKMDLQPDSIAAYYRGNEEEFRPARTYQSMLEVSHSHLPVMAVVILLLTHLIIFIPFPKAMKYILIGVTFGSALLNEVSNYLIRFVDPMFAWLKIGAFLSLQSSMLLLVIILSIFIMRSHQQEKTNADTIEE
jgi:hypothetical protein